MLRTCAFSIDAIVCFTKYGLSKGIEMRCYRRIQNESWKDHNRGWSKVQRDYYGRHRKEEGNPVWTYLSYVGPTPDIDAVVRDGRRKTESRTTKQKMDWRHPGVVQQRRAMNLTLTADKEKRKLVASHNGPSWPREMKKRNDEDAYIVHFVFHFVSIIQGLNFRVHIMLIDYKTCCSFELVCLQSYVLN